MHRSYFVILATIIVVLPLQGLSQELPAACSVYPTSLDFATVKVGLSKDIYFSITNTGGDTLEGMISESCAEFSVVSGGGSYRLAEGQSRIVTVRFAPASMGSKACIIETGNNTCSDVSCTGMGEIPTMCSISPTSLEYGRVDEGQWSDRSFAITNAGSGILSGQVSESCGEFEIVSGGGSYSLGSGATRTVTVRFVPVSVGLKNCTVFTGSKSCPDVLCSGQCGVLPACSVDVVSLDFDTVLVGDATDLDFTITNIGGGTLNGTVSESCADYSIISGGIPYSLGAGQSMVVTVRFAPSSTGIMTCSIETGDNLCRDVTCSGYADMPPSCFLSAESLEFGTVMVGETADLEFSVTNAGGGFLHGEIGESCAPFAILSGNGPYSLGTGQSIAVTVRFAPVLMGSTSCIIETGDALCPDVICAGLGEMPPLCSITPASLDCGTVLLGDSSDVDVTITNIGGGILTGQLNEACEEFSLVSGGAYSLEAGESATMAVRFRPASIGSRYCSIETGTDLCPDVDCSGQGDVLPSCFIDELHLSFGMVDVGEWTDLSFVLANTGGGTLSGVISESCEHFDVIGGEGAYHLQGGETLMVTVRFAPASLGNKNCIIETGNMLCDQVSCLGTGGNIPVCSINPAELDFGTVYVGVSKDIYCVISNIGGGTLDGMVSESCPDFLVVSGGGSYSLAAGESRFVTVQFAPLSVGDKTCTIETGSELCGDVTCLGTGDTRSSCSVDPEVLDFGTVLVGETADLSFTLKNMGTETLTGNISELCGDFSIVSGSGSYNLVAGESRMVTVRFTPASAGDKTCVIETGSGVCDDVSCSGAGGIPSLCSVDPVNLDFGAVTVAESAELSFTIMNTGGETLTGSLSESCGDFSIVSGSGSYNLMAGESRTVTVRFTPASAGDNICVIETGSGVCDDVSCSGTGEAGPLCSLDPENLDYGMVLVGESVDLDCTIANSGGGTLTGIVIETCADFSIVSGGGAYSLGAGQSRIVTVRFAPASVGEKNCVIETGSDLCDDMVWSGTGYIDPLCSVDPTELHFGTVIVGQSADLDFAVTNDGGGTLTGTLSESCGDFIIVSGAGSYSLGVGQSHAVRVRFMSLSPGAKSCTIQTGSDLCQDVSCSGNSEGPTSVEPADVFASPASLELLGNYPNPFNPITTISYRLPAISYPAHTTLKIYNLLGQEVAILVDEVKDQGYYTVAWDGRDRTGAEVASGIYVCRLQAGISSLTHMMLLMK